MVVRPKLTLKEINEILAILDGDCDVLSDVELRKYISQITIGMPFQKLELENGISYRGRPNVDEKFFTNTKELWFPPIHCVKCNRFNDDKTQMLYVAESKSTVIEEVKPSKGSLFTLITYTSNTKMSFLPVGILAETTKTRLFDQKYWQRIIADKLKIYNYNFQYMQIDETVNKYLFGHLTKENKTGESKEYRFTNIYGQHFLNDLIDGLIYPSVSRKLFDINFAIKASSAKKMKITQVDVIRMDDEVEGRFKIVTGSDSFLANGDIIYNNKSGDFNELTKV